MRKIMIVSDTHRRLINLAEALYQEGEIDMLLHLGDIEGEEDAIEEMSSCPFVYVPGNNDFCSAQSREKEREIAGRKVLLTHGHYYYVSLDLQTIREEGIARGMDIVMFGHTHRPVISVEDNITLINPGSISYPRQDDKKPTYIMMRVDDNNNISYELKYI